MILTNTHTPWYKIRYDLNGGEYNGSTKRIVENYKAGTEILIHEAPARDGYEFLFWKGSEYQPGDKYAVTEDHTFTAQWKKKTDPEDSDDPSDDPEDPDTPSENKPPVKPQEGRTARTGDDNPLGLWISVMLMSLLGLAGTALRRRR
ncbi:MAG: InlB B-repeat-containing protein [Mogibacterium sp.]|nr:InlB B-repeat-containing protein [Mogibacterium sp.]